MTEYAIEVQSVKKTYGSHVVLDNISINIPRGKITTILGFSGAGKSTLLKHLLGITKADEGIIKILGQNIYELNKTELRDFRRNFGMLFQYAALFDSLTSIENVEFPLHEFTSMTPQEISKKAKELLTSVSLEEQSFDKYPSELSGGMRKRVGLARALALSPSIMLYDEPTTGLDPITTKMVNDLIKSTAEKNKSHQLTSVIISHDVKATLEISDYVAFLERGRVVEFETVEKFTQLNNPLVKKFLTL